MRKKLNYLRHFIVFALTSLIFFTGVLIGNQVDDLRVNDIYLKLQKQDLDFQNILTEKAYLESLITQKEEGRKNVSCEFLEFSYVKSLKYLDQSRIKLEEFTSQADDKNEADFEMLKDYYSNVQINYWLLSERINQLCSADMDSILYFYAEKKTCPQCYDQGIHLDYVKKVLQDDISIFVFDSEKEGPIQLLMRSFNITGTQMPKIVINDNVYDFKTNEEIFTILCDDGLVSDSCKN